MATLKRKRKRNRRNPRLSSYSTRSASYRNDFSSPLPLTFDLKSDLVHPADPTPALWEGPLHCCNPPQCGESNERRCPELRRRRPCPSVHRLRRNRECLRQRGPASSPV